VLDLNADLGEIDGDLALLASVTSANVACGGHAGDASSMARAVDEALARGVVIGAHAGYEDRPGFGRTELGLPPAEAAAAVARQLEALQAVASAAGARVAYLKLHGALYHRAAADGVLATLVCDLLERAGDLGVLAQPGALLEEAGLRGLPRAVEGFCDRAYLPDGRLVERSEPGAVLDHDGSLRQALALATDGRVTAVDGSVVPLSVDSLCLHGDTPGALALARDVRAALSGAGVTVRSCFAR